MFLLSASIIAAAIICLSLSACDSILNTRAAADDTAPNLLPTPHPQAATPSPSFTPSPSPTFTPSPSPTFTPSPTPVFTKDDLNMLDSRLSLLIGRYKIELARSLLDESLSKGISDTDFNLLKSKIDAYEDYQTNLVPYNGEIEHLFTHCLIAFPEICYSGNKMSASLDIDCITPYEFKRILQSLYEKDYILIDANIIFMETEANTVQLTELFLPEGKKPLIFSIDDVVYDARKAHTGMVDKLIVDNQDCIATYTRHPDGTEIISYDNEIFPILDSFVTEHPEFSFRGAKGTLALTGFQGILGYRTQSDAPEDKDRARELEDVAKVVSVLKDSGWNFGSHSYGHGHMNTKMSLNSVQNDTDQWHSEVKPLIGETQLFFYPYGETVRQSDPKYDVLYDAGFRIFFGVGWKASYMEVLSGGRGILQNRRNLDGYTLRNGRDALLQFFDADEVIDPIRH